MQVLQEMTQPVVVLAEALVEVIAETAYSVVHLALYWRRRLLRWQQQCLRQQCLRQEAELRRSLD